MIRFILGTRPEVIKQAPLWRALQRHGIPFQILLTGQHADLLAGTGIEQWTQVRSLAIPSQNDPLAYVDAARWALHSVFANGECEGVVVQGDTSSALAGAQAGDASGVPVYHLEAGLRSHDESDPWPEENFRVQIDRLASHRFCPTTGNLHNLEDECLDGVVTGNTVIDQLRWLEVLPKKQTLRENGPVLITLHRRESFGQPLQDILKGVAVVASATPDTAFLWPVHPNPKVQEAIEVIDLPVNVLRRAPLPHAGFLEILRSCRAVLTDSGGVIEEASYLGIPTVIARNHTERQEAVGDTATLAGTATEGIVTGLTWGLAETTLWATKPSSVFGIGTAAEQIVKSFT